VKPTRPDASRVEEGAEWPLNGLTMIGHKRLENIRWCVEEIVQAEVPGDLIDAGVWRGGAGIFMNAILERTKIQHDTCG
jgi:Macrocin-O-methyltransferase (TylF)